MASVNCRHSAPMRIFKPSCNSTDCPPTSQLLVTESGHVGTASVKGWVTLTAQVEKQADLKLFRDQLKAKASKAGGALRSSGKVTLGQMLRFYNLLLPNTVEQALALVKWFGINLHTAPGI